jgi:RNA polymerase sigma-70 factor (ECF subfamily)
MPRSDHPNAGSGLGGPLEAETTFRLLERVHAGDPAALDALFGRYLKPLQRWASGRLPRWAREAADTHDLVQDTLLNTFKKINGFEPRREGAFQAYLRRAVMNRIRDQLRKVAGQPAPAALGEDCEATGASPLDQAIGTETLERYERALHRLEAEDREAIVARVELGQSYQDLAVAFSKRSPDAARMMVTRALVRLAEEMNRGRG